MAVPKKRLTNTRTRIRQRSWKDKVIKAHKSIALDKCVQCGHEKQRHFACPKCK